MPEISASVPFGGGTIQSTPGNQNYMNNAYAYTWLGGSNDKLCISVRLQKDPSYAIIDTYEVGDFRTESINGVSVDTLLKSKLHPFTGADSFTASSATGSYGLDQRIIRMCRINSTTALLKIPYDEDHSDYIVLEVDQSTGEATPYVFNGSSAAQGTSAGFYSYYGSNSNDATVGAQMLMQPVEDNVIVTYEQDSSTTHLCQKVWDPSAKTLTSTKVAANYRTYADIDNFKTQYPIQRGEGGEETNSRYYEIGDTNQSQPRYISTVEGRDGKWYFRQCTQGGSSRSYDNTYYPADTAFVYIPTSMGGDLATSGTSQSWGFASGFGNRDFANTGASQWSNNEKQYGSLTDSMGRTGVFLPLNVVPATNASKPTTFPTFYMKSWIEVGFNRCKVITNGVQGTEVLYHPSDSSTGSNARTRQAMWLNSNHFFVYSAPTGSNSNWQSSGINYQRVTVVQYVDETYMIRELNTDMGSSNYAHFTGMANQFQQLDEGTIITSAFKEFSTIFAQAV
tara:strand:- start:612 stop:2138 length:1527 start_codon:yes stop_codon:yes gene_type:complete